MQTRSEHLAWCKQRAWQDFDYYLKKEGFESAARNAVASMLSDLGKHAETKSSQKIGAALMFMPMHSRSDLARFIDGFN